MRELIIVGFISLFGYIGVTTYEAYQSGYDRSTPLMEEVQKR